MQEKNKKIFIISLGLLLALVLFFFFFFFSAQVTAFDFAKDSGLGTTAGSAGYSINETNTIEGIIGRIIFVILTFIGVVFLILMVYGGFLWMTGRDNDEQINKAKNLIKAAIIGLVITFASYAISYFVINSLPTYRLDRAPEDVSPESEEGGDDWVDPRHQPDYNDPDYWSGY